MTDNFPVIVRTELRSQQLVKCISRTGLGPVSWRSTTVKGLGPVSWRPTTVKGLGPVSWRPTTVK